MPIQTKRDVSAKVFLFLKKATVVWILTAVVLVLTFGLPVMPVFGGEGQGEKAARRSAAKPAGCYKLISGKNDEMCRLFEQNLNRFCDEPPMVCERRIHPDFAKYFSFPDWEQVDPRAHLDIIADYIRARAPKYALCPENDGRCQAQWREKKWQEYKPELLERMKAGKVNLSRAKIYIFNKNRLVYRLVDYPCSPSNEICWDFPQVPKLFSVEEKTGKFDPEFTAIKPFSFYDAIFYKNEKEAYTVEWEGGTPVLISGRLRIGQPPFTTCLFKYTNKKGVRK